MFRSKAQKGSENDRIGRRNAFLDGSAHAKVISFVHHATMLRSSAQAMLVYFALLTLSACSSVSSTSGTSKLSRIKALPIGSDKAAILKEFGAPVRIEMIDKKLSYTYEKKQKSKVVSSVTLMFDDKNKVIAKAIH